MSRQAALIRVLLVIVATVCALVLVLGYRTPNLPHDRLAGRVAVAPRQAGHPERHRCPPAGVRTSVTGPWQAWRLGHLRVRVTLVGCRIADVAAAGLTTTNPVSRRRSRTAVSVLRAEVLARQCTDVDVVSGATYTSSAYLRSLQAALDAAHVANPCR